MIEIYVSTYERYVIGYRLADHGSKLNQILERDPNAIESKRKLDLLFRIHSAVTSLRCSANNSKVLACGSADEAIYLFDLLERRELGAARFHSATVTCLDFFKHKLMLSGASDGGLCIWDAVSNNFALIKQFRVKHAFSSISVEPSLGKVALTTDAGGYLKVWDLESCVLAYSLRVAWKPHTVLWMNESSKREATENVFLLLGDSILDVRKLSNGRSVAIFELQNLGTLTCAKFVNRDSVVVSTASGHLVLACLNDGKSIELRNAHSSRIKGLAVVKNAPESESEFVVVSASSDGYVKAWALNTESENIGLEFLALTNVKCRITSLTAAWLPN